MPDNFEIGMTESDVATPPIASETMGARYGVKVIKPAVGAPGPFHEPYLMPSVHGRNGSMEKVDPAITLTPLGGMMPGPNATPPAVPAGAVGATPINETSGEFGAGVSDSYPEGCPVPLR